MYSKYADNIIRCSFDCKYSDPQVKSREPFLASICSLYIAIDCYI